MLHYIYNTPKVSSELIINVRYFLYVTLYLKRFNNLIWCFRLISILFTSTTHIFITKKYNVNFVN